MSPLLAATAAAGLALPAGLSAAAWRRARRDGHDRWMPSYLRAVGGRRAPAADAPIHVFLCIADHFEPWNNRQDLARAQQRVRRWVDEYPERLGGFRDCDGRPPQHTFFYPAEEYEPGLVDQLQGLCRQGFGEIEVHLHHDNDTPAGLAARLAAFTQKLADHGCMAHHRESGEHGFVFVHGNWALCNSRADGRMCGVDNELSVLQAAGCYADMTFPSCPSTTQPQTINSIYRASDAARPRRSHDRGIALRAGAAAGKGLLMIQGPLVFDWSRRKYGLLPRIENACLQASQPPAIRRLKNWLRAGVRVAGRPDWYFVKLHAHGAVEAHTDVLLGSAMSEFHEGLARRAASSPLSFHYVTAREMVNVALAAEAGVAQWRPDLRDFRWSPPETSPRQRPALRRAGSAALG